MVKRSILIEISDYSVNMHNFRHENIYQVTVCIIKTVGGDVSTKPVYLDTYVFLKSHAMIRHDAILGPDKTV